MSFLGGGTLVPGPMSLLGVPHPVLTRVGVPSSSPYLGEGVAWPGWDVTGDNPSPPPPPDWVCLGMPLAFTLEDFLGGVLLPPAFQRNEEGNVFTRVCLSVNTRGGGYSIQCWRGGGGGVHLPRSGRGYPILPKGGVPLSQVRMGGTPSQGYPLLYVDRRGCLLTLMLHKRATDNLVIVIPGQDGEDSIPGQDRGYPLCQDWMGVPPLPQSGDRETEQLRGGRYACCVHQGGLSYFEYLWRTSCLMFGPNFLH